MDGIEALKLLLQCFYWAGGVVMEYLAHYDKEKGHKQLLKEHLLAVGDACKNKVPPTVVFEDISNDMVKEIAYIVGTFHDIGKYTSYFQKYIRDKRKSVNSEHAHISALYIYIVLKDIIQVDKEQDREIILLLSYLCARFHHSSLTIDIAHSDKAKERKMWRNIQIKWENLLRYKFEIAGDLNELINIEINLEKLRDIETIIKNGNVARTARDFRNGKIKKSQWFFLFTYIFSLLIDTDKMDSASIKTEEIKAISPNKVQEYLSTKPKSHNLVKKREKARKTILYSMNKLTDKEIQETKFFTLTAPTGIGKTLSSLQVALVLQERIANIEGYIPRIITAIPFINIIEQNKLEYENVIGTDGRIVVHHRLNDFSKSKSAGENIPIDKKLMEVESWEGDFILTTFVQLFQSIFTGKNRSLKKIHKLAGSIVILDEAQAIPENYMPVVGAILIELSKYLGTRFILMTATQPKIIDFGNLIIKASNLKVATLLPDYKNYFRDLTRTKLVPMLEEGLDLDGFIDLFFEKWNKAESALVVVNTIKRSIEVFDEIKKQLGKKNIGVPINYLSTNITPCERRELIKKIQEQLKDNPVILISTQTIEAGVDLDFDMGFRDFAPLDSIIQTAGRVNREGKKENYRPVYIFKIMRDTDYIYDLMLRSDTLELLLAEDEIYEEEYEKLADKYYSEALNRGISDDSLELWQEGILKLNFDVIEEFKLIDTNDAEDVFVEINEEASKIADLYEKVFKGEIIEKRMLEDVFGKKENLDEYAQELDIFQRRTLLRLVSTKLNDYIIQVRINRLKKNKPIEFSARGSAYTELYWIPSIQLEDYYNNETGFKAENVEAYLF